MGRGPLPRRTFIARKSGVCLHANSSSPPPPPRNSCRAHDPPARRKNVPYTSRCVISGPSRWRKTSDQGGQSRWSGGSLLERMYCMHCAAKMAEQQQQQQQPEQVKLEVQVDDTQAYDEAIIAQQEKIQQEIAMATPLVSDKHDISVLMREYNDDDEVYQKKIKDLCNKYSHIRMTRRDGNCFYRAFGFAHLEALMDNPKDLQKFKAVAAKSKDELVSLGFPEFTIEDFHSTFLDIIEMVEKQATLEDVRGSFNEQSTSDYVVVYLRLLTSGYLQKESIFFEHFVEGGRTVKEFCSQEVEPMAKESDHIHIIALAQALGVSIRVEYMDRGEGGSVNHHDFPEGTEPFVYLLYRPGHYDILYKC